MNKETPNAEVQQDLGVIELEERLEMAQLSSLNTSTFRCGTPVR